ncbi:MAG: hormogonium polysaccharide biosynthesis glycosyltransferase HpsE [Leptolyngbya sp. BL-A-14]
MSIDFTVAICTYNGEQRLPAVLDQLCKQVGTEGIFWEVLIIDNNSQDQTAVVVANYAKQWRSDSQIRYVFEPKQPTAYARNRAIQEAASDLVGFMDDDCLPADNWLAEAYQFGQTHPQAGAYGGRTYIKSNEALPPDFHAIKFLLAIEDRGEHSFQYTVPGTVPGGPCFVVRKQAWQEAVPTNRRLRGKDTIRGTVVSNAEDIEIVIYIQSSHWQVWHNPKMEVWHQIQTGRLQRDHLLKLARSGGLSAHACRIAKLPPVRRAWMPLLLPVYMLVSALRVLQYYVQHQREFSNDLGKACSFQYKVGVLLSPFFTPRPMSSKS